jgi:hypothetical protein
VKHIYHMGLSMADGAVNMEDDTQESYNAGELYEQI